MIQDISPHTFNNQYRPDRQPCPDDIVFAFDGARPLCREEDGTLRFPRVKNLTRGRFFCQDLIYLFSIDDRAFYLLPGEAADQAHATDLADYDYLEIWRSRLERHVPREMMFAIATGKHLAHWYHTHRHCGCCGAANVLAQDERALVCPACGFRTYPRIMPAVIIGVTDGDKILVTRYCDRPLAYHALVAGFVEIGETLEECVDREVMEEVGLKVTNIRYYKSQPWGIADDLLTGFFCDVDGDPTVRLDHKELGEAIWYPRGEVPLQPDDFSLTSEMMRMFNDGKI